jgi:hypothetical protein
MIVSLKVTEIPLIILSSFPTDFRKNCDENNNNGDKLLLQLSFNPGHKGWHPARLTKMSSL